MAVGPIFSHGIGGRVEALLFSYVLAHENGEIGQCAQDGGEIPSLDTQNDRVHVGGPLYIQAGQDEGAAQEEGRDQQDRVPFVDVRPVFAAGADLIDEEEGCRDPDDGGHADVQCAHVGADHGGDPGPEVVDKGSCADHVVGRNVGQDVADLGRCVDARLEFHEEACGDLKPDEVEQDREAGGAALEQEGGLLRREPPRRDHEEQQEQDDIDDLELRQDQGSDAQD